MQSLRPITLRPVLSRPVPRDLSRSVSGFASLTALICLIVGCLALAPAPGATAQPATLDVTEAPTATDEAGVVQAPNIVGWLTLDDALREGPKRFAWMTNEEAGLSLRTVLHQLDTVAKEDRYLGVVINLDSPMLSITQAQAIGEAMRKVSAAGKTVMTFAESYDLLGYFLASHADLVLLQHKGEIGLMGLGVEEMYLAGMLEKIGVEADFVQIGKFKGADEALTRREPSQWWSQNIDALLDDLYGQVIQTMAQGRTMSVADFEAAMRDSWTMSDEDYLARGLVDRLVDRDLIDVTEVEFGSGFVWDDTMGREPEVVNVDSPFALFNMLFQQPNQRLRRPTIALVHGDGPIHSGESTFDDGVFGTDSIGSKTILDVFAELRDEEQVKGVVFRIDSPGGSALASEMIWQGLRDLGESKPVYIAVSGMVASGGYYIASAGNEVFVAPEGIVGSIGVVGGKLAMGGLYDWMGVGVTRRVRGPWGDLFNSETGFTDEQRAMIRTSMEQVYDQFVDRVSIGRGSRLADVGAVAEGRLFTGRRAVELHMADRLGTVEDAIAALAGEVGLETGQYDVKSWPQPMSLQQYLEDAFGAHAPAVAAAQNDRRQAPAELQSQLNGLLAAAQALLGHELTDAVRQRLFAIMLLREEPVLALTPAGLRLR